MTPEFDDRHQRVLRAAERPIPLPDDARRRVRRAMLDALGEARSPGAHDPAVTDEVDTGGRGSAVPVLDLREATKAGDRSGRREPVRRRRRLAAIALAVAAALVVIVPLATRDDRGSPVDVAGPDETAGVDSEVADAVRTWCVSELTDLQASLDRLAASPGDNEARRAADESLAASAQRFFDFLDENRHPDTTKRLDEVGRIAGEAVLLLDGGTSRPNTVLFELVRRLTAETERASNRAPGCEISS